LARAVTTVLNLELATSEDIVQLACALRPHQATLVPERGVGAWLGFRCIIEAMP
jgi:pyridoxine 5'-phosphate synthase PdxJ